MRITDGRAAVHLEWAGRWPVAVIRYTAAGLCSERNLGKGHQLPLHNQPYHLEQGRTEMRGLCKGTEIIYIRMLVLDLICCDTL